MKAFVTFFKKELLDSIRSGRLLLLGILFCAFGIMNPAVAKLTPWLLEMFADSLEGSGMTITAVTITALDSWVQFYKNIPMALIAFVLLQGGIFTKEYASGTLVLSLTKGLARFKVVIAKTAVLLILWTVGYWMCFGITYAYNAYFWDNAIAKSLAFSAVCWWIFGVFVITLMILFSTLFRTNAGVLLGSGGVVLVCAVIGMIPKCSKYLPTFLMDGNSLIYGLSEPKTYLASMVITAATALLCFAVSVPLFNQKQL